MALQVSELPDPFKLQESCKLFPPEGMIQLERNHHTGARKHWLQGGALCESMDIRSTRSYALVSIPSKTSWECSLRGQRGVSLTNGAPRTPRNGVLRVK